MADKKAAPLPASSGGLMRFFEDETKGFKIDPRIVVTIPISLIAISWIMQTYFSLREKTMEQESDDVSNIHNRFSLTLVNPGSQVFFTGSSFI